MTSIYDKLKKTIPADSVSGKDYQNVLRKFFKWRNNNSNTKIIIRWNDAKLISMQLLYHCSQLVKYKNFD